MPAPPKPNEWIRIQIRMEEGMRGRGDLFFAIILLCNYILCLLLDDRGAGSRLTQSRSFVF